MTVKVNNKFKEYEDKNNLEIIKNCIDCKESYES